MQDMAQDESYQQRFMPQNMRGGEAVETTYPTLRPSTAYAGCAYGGVSQGGGGGGGGMFGGVSQGEGGGGGGVYGGVRQGDGGGGMYGGVSRGAMGGGRASGRRSKLEDLKGELYSIRDRFRDVKIEEMKMEEQRLKLGEAHSLAQGAGRQGHPGARNGCGTHADARGCGSARQGDQQAEALGSYFAKFDQKKAATMQRAQAQAQAQADESQGSSAARKEAAKAYFERTRGVHDSAWLHRAEAEAYFEEKRKMADAAWRMQRMLDSKPQQWQIEMEEERQRQAKGGRGKNKGKATTAARPKAAAAAPAPKEKKPQASAGYLFPWGMPKATKAPPPPPPSQHDVIRPVPDDVSAPAPDFDKLEYPTPESFAPGQLEGLSGTPPQCNQESTLLPVSFNPSLLPEDMPRSFDYSTVGFGTTPSFEPLSPRGYRAPLDLGGIDLGVEGLGLRPAKPQPLPTSFAPRRAPPTKPAYSDTAFGSTAYSDKMQGLGGSQGQGAEGTAAPLQFPSSTLLTLASEEAPSETRPVGSPSLEPYALRPLNMKPPAGSPAGGQMAPKKDYWNARDDSPPSVIQARFSGSLSGGDLSVDQDCDFDPCAFGMLPETKGAGEEDAEGDWDSAYDARGFGALPVIHAAQEDEAQSGLDPSLLAVLRRAQGSQRQAGAATAGVVGKGERLGGSRSESSAARKSIQRVEDIALPSPPMALSVLSTQKGVQELML